MAMSSRASAERMIDILSSMDVILKKGSFYCADLFISYFSINAIWLYGRRSTLLDEFIEVCFRDDSCEIFLVEFILISLETISLGKTRNDHYRLVGAGH